MTLPQRCAPGNTQTLMALCGPDETYGAQLVMIASLWRDDLTNLDKTKLRARHFTDEKLRALAAFVFGSTATFGLNDPETIRRLLVTHCNISGQWVEITFRTIEQVAELLTESVVVGAWGVVNSATRGKTAA